MYETASDLEGAHKKSTMKQKPTLDEIKYEINDQLSMNGTFALVYKQLIELDMQEMEVLHDDLFKLSRTRYCDMLK
jgi:hypothetical protein